MKVFFIIILLISSGLKSFSNVPGYMGKRITLDYQFSYAPLFYIKLPPYNWHRVSLSYTTSRTLRLSVEYEMQRFSDDNMNVYGNHFGISVFYYRLINSIAPVGPYIGTGILYTDAKKYNYYKVNKVKKKKLKEKDKNLVFTMTLGYKRVIYKMVTFDFGFQFGIVPFNLSKDDDFINDIDVIFEEYVFRPYAGIGIIF